MVTVMHAPPNEAPIDEVYVFLSEDEHGRHGLVHGFVGGTEIPLVTSKLRLAELIKPVAAEIARRSGITIKLMKFSQREEIWESNPNNYKRGGES